MRVHAPGNERVVAKLEPLIRREPGCRFRGGKKRFDASIAHGNGVVLEHLPGRLYRDEPALHLPFRLPAHASHSSISQSGGG
jgi:hypothetical protein